ncbi:thioredoxin [Pseudobacteroides cellulosolvens]|uniref:Thioredoxin n=1 Tax=Pseudobacteroides cellulosolvens ATCC 35603 = DSM 2933 TaxID=398512 RepID=A0A0L6JML0_9FIRM|nr:thioredoxin [Pseudobacteroides cellulosolvens]KNY27000.1 thioredoxin [Pseudobacteroides cellulosolvens ATCC 35603 = DSM 2933]
MASEKVLIITKDNFENEVIKSDKPVLVDFWASWCGPCMTIGPIIDSLADEYEGKVKVCKVNVDNEGELTRKYRVMSIPTILVFKNGEVADKVVGSRSKSEFQDVIEKNI